MSIYKSADYEQVLSRIKTKVRALDIQMEGILSEEELIRFEKRHGVCLPQAYRMFLKEVGNGCNMIDGFRLHSLANIDAKN